MTEPTLDADVYRQHHHAYLDAGWTHVLPLPPHAKHSPPEGFTGRNALRPTTKQHEQWAKRGPANIAVRLPADVIGVDLDLYKDPGARLALETITGPLPATWCTTSRVDGSGIRLYRTQPLPAGKRWKANPIPAVEIIQNHHRYIVAPPSIHPEHRAYMWVDETSGDIMHRPPTWDELTELPWQAIDGLTDTDTPGIERPAVAIHLADGDLDPRIARRLQQALDDLAGMPGGRHDTTMRHITTIIRLGERGHTGAPQALHQLREAFTATVAPDRAGGPPEAATEYDNMVAAAATEVATKESTLTSVTDIDNVLANIIPAAITADGQPIEHPEPGPAAPKLTPWLIDWTTLWQREAHTEDWFCEPLLANGRGHALYAGAKSGKSLLMLQATAAMATGQQFLSQPPGPPQHVLYVDYEMTEDDLIERLAAFGYGPDSDLSHLHYILLPSIAPLDTWQGGDLVVEAARDWQCSHVVIDTMGRAVAGDENDADTFRAFYRHTGLALKAAHIGYSRLDHAGKDLEKGQRGSSAKNDDVDVVWRLTRRDGNQLRLEATHRRMSWVPQTVEITVHELDDERRDHRLDNAGTWPAGTAQAAKFLDTAGIPLDATKRICREAAAAAGEKINDRTLLAAIKFRKQNAMKGLESLVRRSCAPDLADLGAQLLRTNISETAKPQVTVVRSPSAPSAPDPPGVGALERISRCAPATPSAEQHVPPIVDVNAILDDVFGDD